MKILTSTRFAGPCPSCVGRPATVSCNLIDLATNALKKAGLYQAGSAVILPRDDTYLTLELVLLHEQLVLLLLSSVIKHEPSPLVLFQVCFPPESHVTCAILSPVSSKF